MLGAVTSSAKALRTMGLARVTLPFQQIGRQGSEEIWKRRLEMLSTRLDERDFDEIIDGCVQASRELAHPLRDPLRRPA
ncbi:hypothetical protein [Caballeronia humi]|uniref:hypothetical protein n=1 Tax=Caballeronia humi TaxID=326474 RepID=UPI001F237EDD|nr:hypothetical protein [Caballeronia humi]